MSEGDFVGNHEAHWFGLSHGTNAQGTLAEV